MSLATDVFRVFQIVNVPIESIPGDFLLKKNSWEYIYTCFDFFGVLLCMRFGKWMKMKLPFCIYQVYWVSNDSLLPYFLQYLSKIYQLNNHVQWTLYLNMFKITTNYELIKTKLKPLLTGLLSFENVYFQGFFWKIQSSKINSGLLSSSIAVTSLRQAFASINMTDNENNSDNNSDNFVNMINASSYFNKGDEISIRLVYQTSLNQKQIWSSNFNINEKWLIGWNLIFF